MDGFTFYEHAAGYDWYQCKCCGALSIGRPVKCPVCEGKAVQHTQEADFTGFDASQRRLRELINRINKEITEDVGAAFDSPREEKEE